MQFTETELAGVWVIDPMPVVDSRGSFARVFCEREMADHGLATRFVQHSRSQSLRKGTLRGLHFQEQPYSEVKLVSCVRGTIFDVVVDLRPGSPTWHRWLSFELTPESMKQVYIPAGFAHGFQTLTDGVEISYMISQFYTPGASTGVRYDDPCFSIDWPLSPTVISEKDRTWPLVA
jgi:dTDP-4-dehydrorhamnose 3,5-epimerase